MNRRTGDEAPWKSRRGFVRQATSRPSSMVVRGLLSDCRYVGAVLRFPKSARVGCVKEGAITRRS